ncbi:pyridoxal-dependent decarboxylase [Dactylosporangium salmoneum]|uniref:pyridoxal-dependent decarboxylase n=1 Tax=Dactylosporangium salmoneum TaxID=53361 RepID=UPI0031D9396F
MDAEQVAPDGSVRWFAQEALMQMAALLHAPRGWWGALYGGLADATVQALLPLRNAAQDLVLYRSAAAHGHVSEAAAVLGLDEVVVPADRGGSVVVEELAAEVQRRRARPTVVVATIGTPWTGAHDDLGAIRSVVRSVSRHYLHVDAPLEGLPVELRSDAGTLFASGADSVVVAGDQFLGVPLPCAFAVGRIRRDWLSSLPKTGRPIGGEVGHAAVLAWYALHEFGVAGLARRARRSNALAGYTVRRLREVGWPAWRNGGSMVVALRPPSLPMQKRWSLPVHDGRSRIVCVPGLTEAHVDRFIAELRLGPPPDATGSAVAESGPPIHSGRAARSEAPG